MTIEKIKNAIDESIETKQSLNEDHYKILLRIAEVIVDSLRNGNKVIFLGNGGSAADAQHLVAELVGKYKIEGRKGLPAIALNCNASIITAVGNDWDFNYIFERQIEALARQGDVIVGISTSGESMNVFNALLKANDIGCITVGFTGKTKCRISSITNINFCVPSNNTPRIQEVHIMAGHIICQLIEESIFHSP